MASPTCTFKCSAVIYSIPPLRSNAGYRAKDWDLKQPLWEGILEILEGEEETSNSDEEDGSLPKLECNIRLVDEKGELFANAPYSSSGHEIQPVTDSSRYYAIRVSDGGDRSATLGLGLIDRNDAFEFNMALQSFRRRATPLVTQNRIQTQTSSTEEVQHVEQETKHASDDEDDDEEFGEFV